jgi:hypothetical protein
MGRSSSRLTRERTLAEGSGGQWIRANATTPPRIASDLR